MAPKRNAREPTPSATSPPQTSTPVATPAPAAVPAKAPIKSSSSHQSPAEVALGIWQNYLDTTPQRTKLIDTFMVFLMVVGVLQFVYCVIVGNYVSGTLEAGNTL
jgi:oligosaccharyltransferase complex subunit epsilon